MKISPTRIEDLFTLEIEPFQDDRGRFARIFCKKEMDLLLGARNVCQINHSITVNKGVLRGLHFQYPPGAEMKLITCIRGSVFDVAIDIRKDSPTFLRWHSEILAENNRKMICIPEGFAHGFQTLESNTELIYFHTDFYEPSHEGGIRYDDPRVEIEWPLEVSEISDRDHGHQYLTESFGGILI
ncbi:dTDP-4-dehydrorhamnose 3,5-epimerase [Thermodesulfobacteriota bacterium]